MRKSEQREEGRRSNGEPCVGSENTGVSRAKAERVSGQSTPMSVPCSLEP